MTFAGHAYKCDTENRWSYRQLPPSWSSVQRYARRAVWESPVPEYLTKLETELTRARKAILDLPRGWDGDNAEPYAPEVFERAASFVRQQLEAVAHSGGTARIPRLLPGPHGTIDVHWKEDTFELLVSIPLNEGSNASFYGDSSEGTVIKGVLPRGQSTGLIEWLTRE